MKRNNENFRGELRERIVDGTDPIKIIGFLTVYTNGAEAYMSLVHSLSGSAKTLYVTAVQSSSSKVRLLEGWPTVCAYLLK